MVVGPFFWIVFVFRVARRRLTVGSRGYPFSLIIRIVEAGAAKAEVVFHAGGILAHLIDFLACQVGPRRKVAWLGRGLLVLENVVYSIPDLAACQRCFVKAGRVIHPLEVAPDGWPVWGDYVCISNDVF